MTVFKLFLFIMSLIKGAQKYLHFDFSVSPSELLHSVEKDPEAELDCRQPVRAAVYKVRLNICLLMDSFLKTGLLVLFRH